MRPIWKEVPDQPVQTKCWTSYIFCASCLSFSFEMCGSLCPACQTVTVNPNKFIEPAPFVLRTILSELDFQCPTCKHTVQLHQLPQHQEYCIQSPTTAPTHVLTPSQRSVSVKPSPLVPVKPIPAAEEKRPAQVNVPSIKQNLQPPLAQHNLWGTTVSLSTTNQPKGSLFIPKGGSLFVPKGGSWIVHHSTVPFTVSGWGNYSPQNRWPGNKIIFLSWK